MQRAAMGLVRGSVVKSRLYPVASVKLHPLYWNETIWTSVLVGIHVQAHCHENEESSLSRLGISGSLLGKCRLDTRLVDRGDVDMVGMFVFRVNSPQRLTQRLSQDS